MVVRHLLIVSRPNYKEARPLLIAFHDPPELTGSTDPRTQRLELHNTWLVSAYSPTYCVVFTDL